MTQSPDTPLLTGDGAFSSGLSVSDFSACLDMGLEPLGLVQGFCVMRSQPNTSQMSLGLGMTPYQPAPNDYVENYHCPHGIVSAEHRMWGQNYQQTWIERIWQQGFSSAYTRMVSEAKELGAHGIVGVFDNVSPLVQDGIVEFKMLGTAVRLERHTSTSLPWSTYLAGQRLAKSIEAGFAPVSIVAAVSSVRVWASCITQYAIEGTGSLLYGQGSDSFEIEQLVSARMNARELVRHSVKVQLQGDQIHGVELLMREHEFGHGDFEIQPVLRGNRVRRFKDFAALSAPRPTVTLS